MPVPTTVLDLDGAQILYDDLRKRAARADGNLADDYQTNQAYAVGDVCIYQDKCYQCNTAIAAPGEAWNAAHWTNIKFIDYLDDSVSDVLSALNQLPTEETGQDLLDEETKNSGLTETALEVIGLLFDRMPQDESAMDIYYSIVLENERLLAIYDIWESERSA